MFGSKGSKEFGGAGPGPAHPPERDAAFCHIQPFLADELIHSEENGCDCVQMKRETRVQAALSPPRTDSVQPLNWGVCERQWVRCLAQGHRPPLPEQVCPQWGSNPEPSVPSLPTLWGHLHPQFSQKFKYQVRNSDIYRAAIFGVQPRTSSLSFSRRLLSDLEETGDVSGRRGAATAGNI